MMSLGSGILLMFTAKMALSFDYQPAKLCLSEDQATIEAI